MTVCRAGTAAALVACALGAGPARSQAPPANPVPQAVPAQQAVPPPPPVGKVVASSDAASPAQAQDGSHAGQQPGVSSSPAGISSSQGGVVGRAVEVFPATPVTNAERTAVRIMDTGLDLHLRPAQASEEASATLVVRNVSATPVARVPLQLSSSLRWESIALAETGGLQPASWTQSPISTDEDHTGYAEEAVVTLPAPLPPGGTLRLSVLYGGSIAQSSERLELLGADPAEADRTDWDAIRPTTDASATSLRGFGNVLWYPVAAPTALLGETNRVVALAAAQRHAGLDATMSLRLTVEYLGDPPDGVLFNGQLQPLTKTPDEDNTLVDQTRGLATAFFPPAPVGFRVPSLFLTAQRADPADGQALEVITANSDAAVPYETAVESLLPLMHDALAPAPLTPMLLLDHAGVPFEDAQFLAASLAPNALPEAIAPHLVAPLAHAFFHIGGAANLWLDEGVPELMSLLWTERTEGRNAALAELRRAAILIALAEPDLSSHPGQTAQTAGEPLTAAASEIMIRLKSSAVLWQLREIVGDAAFREGLTVFRHSLATSPELAQDPRAFERTLEHTSGKELGWFFDDWVYRDRGLPDLTIVAVNPRPLPARLGKDAGSLVAVDVRNDGDAVAEVPVTVRAGSLTASERLRIPAHTLRSTRIVFDGTPETVEVNDGSVPEVRASEHVLNLAEQP